MRYLHHILAITGILMLATTVHAGDKQVGKHGHAGKPSQHGCRIVKCPQCCHECVFSAEKSKEPHSCYDVQCKPICIPRVVFPWQKGRCTCSKGDGKDGCCAIHNGVKKRSVRVLKKYEYECSHCKYQWNVVDDRNRWKDKADHHEMGPVKAAPVPSSPPGGAQHRPQHPPVRVSVR